MSAPGILKEGALRAAVREARQRAGRGGNTIMNEVVMATGWRIDDIAEAAEALLDIAYLDARQLQAAQASFAVVGFGDCLARTILPLRDATGDVFVVPDPWDDTILQWLENRIGRHPTLLWGERADIAQALEQAHLHIKACNGLAGALGPPGAYTDAEAGTGAISIASIERTTSVIIRFVDAAIFDAWRSGASDIHFECGRDGVRVKLRLDGVLIATAELLDSQRAEEVISRIKVLSRLDIAERRTPQDGRFRIEVGGRQMDFRVSIMPSICGEDAVVRLLDKSQLRGDNAPISLEALGLDSDAVQRIRRLAKRPHGMLLVTGPTGSGKTTTLYAALSEIQTGRDKIITIEDPVEYELPGVLQIPVNEKKGLTFSKGLRAILRHDPDKILVGEIRDSETGEIAVQAALTGHLVFTTVHANSVFDVVSRFMHLHIDLYSLTSALNGVVAQRLIRKNCPSCSRPVALSQAEALRLSDAGIDPAAARPAAGGGCTSCRQTGYKGRRAVAEVLPFDEVLRALILNRADVASLRRHALSLGIRPLANRALDLVAAGQTTMEEIERVIAFD